MGRQADEPDRAPGTGASKFSIESDLLALEIKERTVTVSETGLSSLSLHDGFEERLHTQGGLPSASFPDKRRDARKLSARAVYVVMHRILNQAREPGCLHESCHTICPNFLDVEAEPFRHLVLLEMRCSRGAIS